MRLFDFLFGWMFTTEYTIRPPYYWGYGNPAYDKMMSDFQDQRNIFEFEREVHDTAFARLNHWSTDSTCPHIFLRKPFLFESDAHVEKFGNKSCDELVEEKFQEIKNSCYDLEEQYMVEYYHCERRFGTEMADQLMAKKKVALDEYLKSKPCK